MELHPFGPVEIANVNDAFPLTIINKSSNLFWRGALVGVAASGIICIIVYSVYKAKNKKIESDE